MRILLNLQSNTKRKFIPMNYQYYISAWIYKVLKEADSEYATFLHNQGYGKNESHLYKLFFYFNTKLLFMDNI